MNILVVDDEKEIADLIEVYLKNENYNVYKCYNGKDAYQIIKEKTIDLLILDVMMPGIDGFSLCKMIRKNYRFPIIMLTAKGEDMDKIEGLTIGADDYVTKPFTPLELVARVKTQIRRYTKYNDSKKRDATIQIKALTIDKEKYTCFLGDKKLSLTPKEFSILCYLADNRGKVIQTEDLFTNVWKERYLEGNNNTVMVHIRHLREKLNDTSESPIYIKTVWGVGYTIES